MASLTRWTVGDVAELTELAIDIAARERYCEACSIVAVKQGDKYCSRCANDIAQWLYAAYWDGLAQEYMEALAVQEGWY